ncbi:MAG TPA: hypothetical protein VGK19_20225 [Capsulimonadaceae bacterium]|jgi:hypothetical protein
MPSNAPDAYPTVTVAGQPSWKFTSDTVEAYVTRKAGMLAPVYFTLGDRHVQPFSVAPWAEEPVDETLPALLQVLRGDFFCAPFGGNDEPADGVMYPPHGEPANADWTLEAMDIDECGSTIRMSLEGKVRKAHYEKRLSVRSGQTVVYSRHTISGGSGPMAIGHHATLKFPDVPECAAISTSPFVYGQVCSKPFEVAAKKGYQTMKQSGEFYALDQVPLISGEVTDISVYPSRLGFEDLVMIVAAPGDFAWTAAAVPSEGYCWFGLKDPNVLRNTVFWMSNGGRHYSPWSGRHTGVLGLEETTSNFHLGQADSSAPNALTEKGYPTAVELSADKPCVVNYIMGCVAIGTDFDRVATIERTATGIKLTAKSGAVMETSVDVEFLYGAG